ncbi:hypothetical protein F0562_016729 [Nyssa sinensis]|uniref:Uncharacterized protein n=1 Tax=Nyssa sinensis TaxID=561372 RepID=A0A5J4ZFE0_9ASTE|nr:hypothetical protein F0562_016729 [Nyssa sinensis]
MEKSRAEDSSPLSTIEEIQRRLVRPPSLQSQSQSSITINKSRDDIVRCDSLLFDVNSSEFRRKREVTNKRLEDYLDPVLLSVIRTKIGGKRKRDGDMKLKSAEFEFEWPVDELKVFTENCLPTEKLMKWRSDNGVVDLNDDLNLIGGVEEDEHEVSFTPFQRFERMALKRFKGGEG